MTTPRLTTKAACRVAGIDRDRFNEAVARGDYPCAPPTVPGRARFFDSDALIALRLFREFTEEGMEAKRAGALACAIAECARSNPEARAISVVYNYFGPHTFSVHPSDEVPTADKWDSVHFSGTDIRKVLTYRIGKLREMLDHYVKEESSIIGDDDDDPNVLAIKDLTHRWNSGLMTAHEYAEAMTKLVGSEKPE